MSEAYLWKKQYEQASAEAEQVLALNPSDGGIYAGLADILSFLGRPEEALRIGREGAAPQSPAAAQELSSH